LSTFLSQNPDLINRVKYPGPVDLVEKIYPMIRMVVFDMAGTTVDEDNVVYKTLQRAISDHGYVFTLNQVLTAGAGKEKLFAIKSILALQQIKDDILTAQIYQHFITLLSEAYIRLNIMPQPNAEEVFRVLKNQKIFVILNTGYDSKTAQTLIDKLGWEKGKVYDDLVTATNVKTGRPQPDMILFAMHNFGILHSDEVVKVGDSIVDIEEGKNAFCALSIGITTGAHTHHQLLAANPDFIISNLLELPEIISRYNATHS
jgi:phosphonatase-like hydrolase